MMSRANATFAAAMTLCAHPALAHHSVAFYEQDVTRVVGEIVASEWRNPHVILTVEATNDRGLVETWTMETSGIYPLERAGITADMLGVGQELVIAGRRSSREPAKMLALSAELRDGTQLPLWFRFAVDNFDDEASLVDAAAENRGIFRVWSVPATNMFASVEQMADQPFTASAVAARASWDVLDNFATRCEPEGMPRIMVTPHPFEFVDRGDTLLLRTELYDIERVIHMGVAASPADAPASPLGYSVGRWDNGDLIVRTTRVSWPYFDNIGTPLTEDAVITERFSLSEDQARLDFEVLIEDPAVFTRPASIVGHWLALGEQIARFDCQP
ncbi:MAG TPA: DUF6152 family protein [Gammaproteobacteria bacterium]